jgi:hypothetical protein
LRLEREGRHAEAERLQAELLASGLTKRQAQVELVKRLQPLDGAKARAWETPDPWEQGRLFKRKADQQKVLESVKHEEDEDEDEELSEEEDRLFWAELRRDERQALAEARRRARDRKQEQERPQRRAKRAQARNGSQQKALARKRRWVDSDVI